jgi:hypothetical protein
VRLAVLLLSIKSRDAVKLSLRPLSSFRRFSATVYLAAILEYLAAELIQVAGDLAQRVSTPLFPSTETDFSLFCAVAEKKTFLSSSQNTSTALLQSMPT